MRKQNYISEERYKKEISQLLSDRGYSVGIELDENKSMSPDEKDSIFMKTCNSIEEITYIIYGERFPE